jgi:hypothetical protein
MFPICIPSLRCTMSDCSPHSFLSFPKERQTCADLLPPEHPPLLHYHAVSLYINLLSLLHGNPNLMIFFSDLFYRRRADFSLSLTLA